jgi:CRP-like cAMP-binding protein
MTATQAIRELIEGHLRTIDAEVLSLREALERLDQNGSPSVTAHPGSRRRAAASSRPRAADSSRPRAAAGRGGARGRRRRASASSVDVAGLLAASDGLTTSAIAEQSGLERGEALTRLKELEAKGEIRRSGQRRAVRWHAITDEDRIRARAAELERASQAARSRRAA